MTTPAPLTNTYPSLAGRTVFITGGATGIGAELVSAFAAQKAKVSFVDLQKDAGKSLADTTGASFFECDLRDTCKLADIIAKVGEANGPISVLVNNAADDTRHDFREVTEAYWDDRIAVNLRHAFFAIKAAHSQMLEAGGGSIVNFGSMSWYECQGGMTGYTTSKAAIEGMTRGLARDLGADNIRINTLVPGWVMTPKQKAMWVGEEVKREIERGQSLKSELLPQDICAMALFLASDDARMCTAQSFIVDGGWI
ncbi:SDR family oxidoreductase [Henriciella mobilis]|uniref:SDR family NAD(P)-dependent oxidoreductase n=1 Tax=Henriciella mobilis TaxID=2305467 RepID=UPI000E66C47A|nr:SDR family oxidoreductase [Henriciella mobilis]RIJ13733.1 SDR family oxidoreductase [Henriciella mobilis]RIJ21059.1 SDR family oxidoreductase [Henriciella mobilis]